MSLISGGFNVSGYSTGTTGIEINTELVLQVNGLEFDGTALKGSAIQYITGYGYVSGHTMTSTYSGLMIWDDNENEWAASVIISDTNQATLSGASSARWDFNSGTTHASATGFSTGALIFANGAADSWNAVTNQNGSVDDADGQHTHSVASDLSDHESDTSNTHGMEHDDEGDDIYKATYNFADDADGSNPDGWTVDEGGGTVNVISSLGGHSKVVEMDDTDGSNLVYMKNSFSQSSGTVEFWFRMDDTNEGSGLRLRDGSNSGVTIGTDSGNLRYYDGSWNNIMAISSDTWYHIRIEFDCSTDTFDIWVDGNKEGNDLGFWNPLGSIDNFYISTADSSANYKCFVDAVGYSWDSDYDIGDNWLHGKWIKNNSIETEDIVPQTYEEGTIGYPKAFEYIRAKYVQDDDGSIGSYDMLDDLEEIRNLEKEKEAKRINGRNIIPYKRNTLPWTKRDVKVPIYEENPDDLENPNIIGWEDKIISLKYTNMGEKLGFLLSVIEKLVERQDQIIKQLGKSE